MEKIKKESPASAERPGRFRQDFSGVSRTKQSFKNECDVNRIVARFADTGILTHTNSRNPQYGFASAQSFTEAAYLVAEARDNFMQLPANIRSAFNNDPAEFLDAASDPERQQELADLGLIEPLPLPIPTDEVASHEPSLDPPSDEAPNPPVQAEKTA